MKSWWKGAHPGPGDLRACLDGELVAARQVPILDHLQQCPACRAALQRIRATAGQTSVLLATLQAPAWSAWRRWVPYMAVAALAALMVVTIAVPPVRAVAAQWLSLFRTEQIALVRVDTGDWHDDGAALATRLTPDQARRMARITGPTQPVAPEPMSLDEAQGLHQPTLPSGLAEPPDRILGVRPAEYLIEPDVDAINAWLGSQGVPARLGAGLKGQTIRVTTPSGVVRIWGEQTDRPLALAEGKGLEVSGTAEVNLRALADLAAQLAGAPASLTRQLQAIPDLSHTLVLPVTEDMGEPVQVENNPGVYYAQGNGSALVWSQAGKVFVLTGRYSRDELLQAAHWARP